MSLTSTTWLKVGTAAFVAAVAIACNEATPTASGPAVPEFVLRDFGAGDGQPVPEEIELCKYGSSADFAMTMDQQSPAGPTNLNLTLQDATNDVSNCRKVGEFDGNVPADINITEMTANLPPDIKFDSVQYIAVHGLYNQPLGWVIDPPVTSTTNLFSWSQAGHALGFVVKFYNSPVETPPPGTGRMTGGGQQTDVNGVDISRGFTIHCDIKLSNNLEFNWPGYKWHIDKPLTKAACFDDPNIDQKPPAAPLDTFIGEGIGTLNGVDGFPGQVHLRGRGRAGPQRHGEDPDLGREWYAGAGCAN